MTPDALFASELVWMSFVLGIVLSIALYERLHLTTGSVVVPGYMGVFILQPSMVVATLINAVVCYLLVHCLMSKVVLLSAKSKFLALVVTSVFFQFVSRMVAGQTRHTSTAVSLMVGVGYVVPALIAHDMARQGALKSLGVVVGASAVTGACALTVARLFAATLMAPAAPTSPTFAFPIAWLPAAILLSVLATAGLDAGDRAKPGGFVGAAYLALFSTHPGQLVLILVPAVLSIVRSFIVVFRSAKDRKNATFAERKATLISRTMLTYVITTKLLVPRMILFGRRKFAAMLLVGALVTWGGMLLFERVCAWHQLPLSTPALSVMAIVLVGLVANDAERRDWGSVMKSMALAVPFTLAGTWLAMEWCWDQRLEVLWPLTTVAIGTGAFIFAPWGTALAHWLFAPAATFDVRFADGGQFFEDSGPNT